MVTNIKGNFTFFKPLLFLLGLLFFCAEMPAQKKYWVKFKDKNGTPYSLSNPSAFLTQKSIARRTKYKIPYNTTDLPVTPSYISGVSSVPGVTVLYTSKWLNGVVITINEATTTYAAAFSQIKTLSFVGDTGRVKRYHLDYLPLNNPDLPAYRSLGSADTLNAYGNSRRQINQLNLDCYHKLGYKGQNMTIAVMDAGFTNVNTGIVFDSLRKNNGIIGTRNFVDGGTNAYMGSSHGTGVMSCMAANIPGVIMGTAPYAKYWLLRTEEGPSETISEEYNWIRAAEFADSVGADILTTSLGYTDFDISAQNHKYSDLNGKTAPMSIAANLAARKGMFVLNAAGNEAQSLWHYISVPGDADSICTVGAVDSLGKRGGFSSVGPTADGRIKPDLSAMGVFTWISDGSVPGQPGDGTSFATPVLAGAVACFWQLNRSLNNIQLLDSMRKLGNQATNPDNNLGWGIPRFPCPALPDPKLEFTFTTSYDYDNSLLKIRLSYTVYDFVNLEIVDLLGKVIYKSDADPRIHNIELDGSTFPSGVYLVKIKTSKGTKAKKVLKRT